MAISSFGVALAQDEEPPAREGLALSATYPRLDAVAGSTFNFVVSLTYNGTEPRVFDLRTTAPSGWDVSVTPQYQTSQKISSISMKPAYGTATDTVNVGAASPYYPLPDPGDYKITLEAVSDNLSAKTELTARVTAKYALAVVPTNQVYNTTAKAGRDNYFAIMVQNTGTAVIDNIKFSSSKPDGWTIDFKPDKIDVQDAYSQQSVDVNIKPPPKTIAGDYMVSLQVSGTQASATSISIRVTVETPTIWGWVGVAIIMIAVVGLVIIFMRFSRR
jgi:uncharacterized membrane protein